MQTDWHGIGFSDEDVKNLCMKGVLVSAFLSISFFATAQSGYQASFVSTTNKRMATSARAGVFSSDWEVAATWAKSVDNNSKMVVLSHNKPLSEINQGVLDKGLVVVFAKGYSLGTAPEKPMSLPFTFFSSDEGLTEGVNWSSQIDNGSAQLQITLPAQLEPHFMNNNAVQFRYFVLSPQFFKENNLSPVKIKSLSYRNFIALLKTNE